LRLLLLSTTELIGKLGTQKVGRLGLHTAQPESLELCITELTASHDFDLWRVAGLLRSIIEDDLIRL
jgi:hypothetical protein